MTERNATCLVPVAWVAMLSLVAGFAVVANTSRLGGQDSWPEFRGPTGDGHAEAAQVPLEWSETQHVTWKVPIPGRGWSSPVVAEGKLWLTTATPEGHELFVLCFDAQSGKQLFEQKLFDVESPQEIHKTNSHASPTPVIDGHRIYVSFGSYGTACLDTQSFKLLWTRRDLPCNHWRGAGSSPIVWHDLLIMHFDGYDYQYVVALEKQTGNTVWRVDRAIDYQTDNGDFKKAFCTPIVIEVAGRPQLISPAAKATLAYDPRTGEEIWRVRYANHSATARPLFGHGLVYINTGFGRAELLGVRPDGSGDVTESHVVWEADKRIGSKPSAVLVGDYLFLVHDGGVATCLEATTGEVVWQERLGGNFSASPIYVSGHLLFSNEEGETFVVAPTREFRLVGVNRLETGCMASPAVADNALFLRTKTHLYRIAE